MHIQCIKEENIRNGKLKVTSLFMLPDFQQSNRSDFSSENPHELQVALVLLLLGTPSHSHPPVLFAGK